jgi:hypothetical protein
MDDDTIVVSLQKLYKGAHDWKNKKQGETSKKLDRTSNEEDDKKIV